MKGDGTKIYETEERREGITNRQEGKRTNMYAKKTDGKVRRGIHPRRE